MPDVTGFGGSDHVADAIAFGVAADLVYNVFSATNSSPQTTELFAGERSATMWKYVKLGGLQGAVLVGIMAVRGKSVWPILGGLVAGGAMWWMYRHALQEGTKAQAGTGWARG
jgi:hypothetical protein